MGGCSIRNCKSRSVKGGETFFCTFPRDEAVAKEWLRYCRPTTNTKYGRVCSKHFVPSDYLITLRQKLLNDIPRKARKIKPDAVPSLLLGTENNEETPSPVTEIHSTIVDSLRESIYSTPKDNEKGKSPKKKLNKIGTSSISKKKKVASAGLPKVVVQNMEILGSQGPILVKVLSESNLVETTEGPPREEVSFDGDQNHDDQTNEDLVPLSAHPGPLSDAPEPVCSVEVQAESDTAGDTIVKKRKKPVRVKKVTDGISQEEQPPAADLSQTSKIELKIQKLTQQRDRARASLHLVRKSLRRRTARVTKLLEQMEVLKEFVTEHHEFDTVDKLIGRAAWRNRMKQISDVKKDERMKEANRQLLIDEQDDQENLPDVQQNSPDSQQSSPDAQITSHDVRPTSPDVQQNLSNIGQNLVVSTSANGPESSVPSTNVNKSDTQQETSVASKPAVIIVKKIHTFQKSTEKIDVPKNRLLVVEPMPENSFEKHPTLEVRQITLPAETKSVDPEIGNKRKLDISQNDGKRRIVIYPDQIIRPKKSLEILQASQIGNKSIIGQNDEKRRVVVLPNLFVRQEKSSVIPQISVGLQRKGLLKKIDSTQNTVTRRKLVRFVDNNVD